MFNPDPFKMSTASPKSKKKGDRPKMPTPNADPFGGKDFSYYSIDYAYPTQMK